MDNNKEPVLSFHLDFDEHVIYLIFCTGIMLNLALLIFILKSMFDVKSFQNYNNNSLQSPPRYEPIE